MCSVRFTSRTRKRMAPKGYTYGIELPRASAGEYARVAAPTVGRRSLCSKLLSGFGKSLAYAWRGLSVIVITFLQYVRLLLLSCLRAYFQCISNTFFCCLTIFLALLICIVLWPQTWHSIGGVIGKVNNAVATVGDIHGTLSEIAGINNITTAPEPTPTTEPTAPSDY